MKIINFKNNYILFLILISVFNGVNAELTPLEGLNNLKLENEKFVNNPIFLKQRKGLVEKQNPSYVILSCSDSRVIPEHIFGQPIGNMFTVRTAGQVIDDVVIDTIEFAINNYDVVNLVVMGHQNCGAVSGALKRLKDNNGKIKMPKAHKGNDLDAVLIPIERAIVEGKVDIYAPDALEKATIANVNYISEQLKKRSSVIRKAIKNKQISLLDSVYSLETGKVKFLLK